MLTDSENKDRQMEADTWREETPNAEEKRVRQWVQMQHRREQSARPDLDAQWQAFRQAKMKPAPKHLHFSVWHLAAAMVVGILFALGGVWLYQDVIGSSIPRRELPRVVALQYDNTPQQIKLEEEGTTLNLTRSDSISFQEKTPVVVAQAQAAPPKPKRLSTPRGMDFKVILPDGSEVWLNAESTIEFPSAFQDGERRVTLHGEAYFKVARNEAHPFIVSSNQMSVRVLGTEFNFKSYASELPQVALVEGKVEVMRPDGTAAEATLNPGEGASYDGHGQLRVQEVDTYSVTQWVKGFFYFHDQPLVDVLRELGRWYNLGVVFRNADAVNYHVHFSALRNEDISVAIESLNRLRHIRVQIEGTDLVVY